MLPDLKTSELDAWLGDFKLGATSKNDTLRACSKRRMPPCGRFWLWGFAGLRTAELQRLDWKEIDLDRGFITVAASKAKTRERCLVPIADNLKLWLESSDFGKRDILGFLGNLRHGNFGTTDQYGK